MSDIGCHAEPADGRCRVRHARASVRGWRWPHAGMGLEIALDNDSDDRRLVQFELNIIENEMPEYPETIVLNKYNSEQYFTSSSIRFDYE